jgi:hypothetical protein
MYTLRELTEEWVSDRFNLIKIASDWGTYLLGVVNLGLVESTVANPNTRLKSIGIVARGAILWIRAGVSGIRAGVEVPVMIADID